MAGVPLDELVYPFTLITASVPVMSISPPSLRVSLITFSRSGEIVAGKATRDCPESAAKSPGDNLQGSIVVIVSVSPGTVDERLMLSKYEADPIVVFTTAATAFTPEDTSCAFIKLTAPVPPPKELSCIANAFGVPLSPFVMFILPVPLKVIVAVFVPSLISISIELPLLIDDIGITGP
jgi:hypothetical protein